MSSTDGKSRPRPLASTSASNRSRAAKRAPESAELGGTKAVEDATGLGRADVSTLIRKSGEIRTDMQQPGEGLAQEIVELPNESSSLGLSRPRLIPYDPEVIDARSRGVIATRLLSLLGLIVVISTVAVVVATFTGDPADVLITYSKWVVSALTPMFTMALGFFFGAAHQSRRHKQ
jgi:hypothetical protein